MNRRNSFASQWHGRPTDTQLTLHNDRTRCPAQTPLSQPLSQFYTPVLSLLYTFNFRWALRKLGFMASEERPLHCIEEQSVAVIAQKIHK